jgi:hypothetical protein
VYRSVDHKTLVGLCGQLSQTKPSVANMPAGGFGNVADFARVTGNLQRQRILADCDPSRSSLVWIATLTFVPCRSNPDSRDRLPPAPPSLTSTAIRTWRAAILRFAQATFRKFPLDRAPRARSPADQPQSGGFSNSEAKLAISDARQAIVWFKTSTHEQKEAFLTMLLFKQRT